MAVRYGANGMPMAEKPKPKNVEPQPTVQPTVQEPAPQPVNTLNNDVEEGNVSKDNE